METDLSKINGLKGLYYDSCIAIDKNMTQSEKGCVLAEEIGHHLTSIGDILDQKIQDNQKQEYRARKVAYDIKIGLVGIINAFEAGCKDVYQIAEFLDVTKDFFEDALSCYKSKYGIYTKLDNYIIYFYPTLNVGKIF
ncbi:ImmA/IrrE family metallo-endopeptidase [Mobilitalea sibirica]|uniref:ImmA/IrrE family metallo-endopeptidase n=2 Tax=Mobilitalea sibirica TaxID=1462919 RepID=A0A8J7H3I5_9FIRM|nr:ImmA/IrrE family metallo-endopeptidase [Mobilitalea sibirica]